MVLPGVVAALWELVGEDGASTVRPSLGLTMSTSVPLGVLGAEGAWEDVEEWISWLKLTPMGWICDGFDGDHVTGRQPLVDREVERWFCPQQR